MTIKILKSLVCLFLCLGLSQGPLLLAQTPDAPWEHLRRDSEREIAPGIIYAHYTAPPDARFSAFRVTAGAWKTRPEAVAALEEGFQARLRGVGERIELRIPEKLVNPVLRAAIAAGAVGRRRIGRQIQDRQRSADHGGVGKSSRGASQIPRIERSRDDL